VATVTRNSDQPRPVRATPRGNATQIDIDPSDALPESRATRANRATTTTPTAGNSTNPPPPPVATPFPPRNRRVTGATWPMVAAAQHAKPRERPSAARPRPVATMPLPTSATNTDTPALRPAVR